MKILSKSCVDDVPVAETLGIYEQWFDGKVAAALVDTRPRIPHRQLIDTLRERLARNCVPRKS